MILLGIVYIAMTFLTILANLKKFKENNKVQTWYYNIVIWGSKVFYGPLYKYSLQTSMVFGSNFKKKKALVKSIIFMLVFGLALGIYQIFQSNVMYLLTPDITLDSSRVYSEYFAANNDNKNFLLGPEIQSKIITNNTIELFVPIFDHETKIIYKACNLKTNRSSKESAQMKQERLQANLTCYASKVKIQIDNKSIFVDFLKADHPKTNQFGLTGFISTEELPSGLHRLKITKEVSSEIQKNWDIPFYFSPNK